MYVISVAQSWFGSVGSKFLATRLGATPKLPGVGGADESAPSAAYQALLPHDPGDSLAAGCLTLGRQGTVNSRSAVCCPAVGEGLMDQAPQHLVAIAATARLPTHPGVVALPRHLEHLTQQRDVMLGLLRLDEREPHLFSLAKKAAAFLRSRVPPPAGPRVGEAG
jgi:hypothetical protein